MKKVRAQVSRCLAKIILGIFVFTTLCLIPQLGTVETAAANYYEDNSRFRNQVRYPL